MTTRDVRPPEPQPSARGACRDDSCEVRPMTTILRVGDTVLWSGAWGYNEPRQARVTRIELVQPDQKEGGVPVDAVPWSAVEQGVVVDLDNGHWAYGFQIRPVQATEPEERCEDCGRARPVRCWNGRYRCHECEQAVRDSLTAEAGSS